MDSKNVDYEYCTKLKNHVPDALFDKIMEDMQRDGNCGIWVCLMECIDEMRSCWEEENGYNLIYFPGHYEKGD